MTRFERLETDQEVPAVAQDLLAAWQRFNASGNRPTRDDFTPFVLKPWLGQIDIYDVEDAGSESGPDFRLRLNGTKTVALTGDDWTGATAREIDRALDVTLHADLQAVYEAGKPLSQPIRLFKKRYITAHRLMLPIFSQAGDGTVSQVFLAIFPIS